MLMCEKRWHETRGKMVQSSKSEVNRKIGFFEKIEKEMKFYQRAEGKIYITNSKGMVWI
jgi:hypothetical protein